MSVCVVIYLLPLFLIANRNDYDVQRTSLAVSIIIKTQHLLNHA
jgi:hypothetical protein